MWGAHKPKLSGVQHRNPIYLVIWTLDDQNLIREDKNLNYRPIKLQTEIMWIIWNWNSWRTNLQSESQQITTCPWQVDIYLCNQAKYKYFSGLDSSMIHSKVNQAWARKNLTQLKSNLRYAFFNSREVHGTKKMQPMHINTTAHQNK